MPLGDSCFDAAYSFEAICHAPDRGLCLSEIWHLVRPGGQIALTEWCMTEVTARATALLERLRIAPAGTGEVARILNVAADALVEAGEAGIFTPCFLVHARKPERGEG